jgi:hypothetical protein
MDEYYEENLDLDIVQVREDFEFIWSKNIVEVDLFREENPQAGDYFREDESPNTIHRKIWLNIQGINSEHYRRMLAGVITPDATLHAFAKYDEDIRNLDVIKFGNWQFRIIGFNDSMYAGQCAFKDFDLKRIDKAE